MFFGRKDELKLLEKLKLKNTASLVCILGRRRIGKSTLIEEYAKSFPSFFEIQGLSPDRQTNLKDQLEHFATQLSLHFNSRKEHFDNWTEAFLALAEKTKTGEHLILLDEISWMGKQDPLFSSRLKEIWDTKFKKNPRLVLVVCGSVSSWIEENILKNAIFEGRVSLEINLGELSLPDAARFWMARHNSMGSLEKMLILSVTGGVPKYLEEVLSTETAEQNLIRLCYTPSGIFFNEYEKIFREIFDRKTKTLDRIVRTCLTQRLSPVELAKKLGTRQNSDLSEHLRILELSGFLSRDFYFKPDGEVSKLSHLRVKDNYLRFYLKHIEPHKESIKKGGKVFKSLYELKGFETILGLQFENLILANRRLLYPFLDLNDSHIVSSAPYVQKKTSTTMGGCQIDLLIHTKLDVFYLCEFKCRRQIDRTVIKEVQRKMDVIKLPKRSSLKPVLVYEGEIYPGHLTELREYFYQLIPLSSLF